MRITQEIYLLALLRRIARAIEEGNSIAKYRADREFPPIPVKPSERKKAVFSRRKDTLDGTPESGAEDIAGNVT